MERLSFVCLYILVSSSISSISVILRINKQVNKNYKNIIECFNLYSLKPLKEELKLILSINMQAYTNQQSPPFQDIFLIVTNRRNHILTE